MFRKSTGKTDEIPQPDESHNIAVYTRQERGPMFTDEQIATMKFVEFLAILKKL